MERREETSAVNQHIRSGMWTVRLPAVILSIVAVLALPFAAQPASATFPAVGGLNTARYAHTATLLPNNQVLSLVATTTAAR